MGIGRQSIISNTICYYGPHISSLQKLSRAGSMLPLTGLKESSICHSPSPDSILYPIFLNIYFTCLALVSIWVWDSYPHVRDAILSLSGVPIYINWHAWIINQTDCLFALLSLCPLLDTASQPSTRIGVLFPPVASFPPHVLLLVMYWSCGPPGKPQQKPLVPFTLLWKSLQEFES